MPSQVPFNAESTQEIPLQDMLRLARLVAASAQGTTPQKIELSESLVNRLRQQSASRETTKNSRTRPKNRWIKDDRQAAAVHSDPVWGNSGRDDMVGIDGPQCWRDLWLDQVTTHAPVCEQAPATGKSKPRKTCRRDSVSISSARLQASQHAEQPQAESIYVRVLMRLLDLLNFVDRTVDRLSGALRKSARNARASKQLQ